MRILLQIIVPLITPIVVYLLWAYWDTKRQGRGLPSWEEGKWFWAILLGVFLAVITLGYFSTTGARVDTEYISPRLENGRVVPGEHN